MPTHRKLVRHRKALNVLRRRISQSGGSMVDPTCHTERCDLCHGDGRWPFLEVPPGTERPPFGTFVTWDERTCIRVHHYRWGFRGATAIRNKRFLAHTLGTSIDHMLYAWKNRP